MYQAKRFTKKFVVMLGLLGLVLWFRRLFKGPTVTLIYGHRVVKDDVYQKPCSLSRLVGNICESELDALIGLIKSRYDIISIDQAIDHLKSGRFKKDSVVLTFDDGFVDNYHVLLPVLEKHNVPATIYINTGVINSNKNLWFQSVLNWFFNIETDSYHLPLNDKTYDLSTAGKRMQGAYDVMRYLQNHCQPEAFWPLLEQYGGELIYSKSLEQDRHLNLQEIKALAQSPLITLGSHTVNHIPLGYCSDKMAEQEITDCHVDLTAYLEKAPVHFSFPRGHARDFNQHHIDVLNRLNYRSAVTTVRGTNFIGADLFRLKRVGMHQQVTGNATNVLWDIAGF